MAPTARWSSAASERGPAHVQRAAALPAAFQADLSVPRAWTLGCRALLGLALWAGGYWLGALSGLWSPGLLGACGCLVGAALSACLCPVSSLPGEAGRLAWDGARWHLRAEQARQPMVGELQVALDPGPWLLLRFDAASHTGSGRRRRWLVVAAGALSPDTLLALRVALYCRRPEPTRADHRDAEPNE